MTATACLRAACLLASLAALAALPLALGRDEAKGKKYALLVGVTEYDSKNFSSLSFCDNDADKMEAALKKAGFASVRVLTSKRGEKDKADAPTAANIQSALKELLAKAKTKHDTVLVGLAGHGMQIEVTPEKGKGEAKQYSYFCPKDASLLGIDYDTGRSDQLVLLDDLFDKMGKSDAGHRLALIDACRNDKKAKGAKRARLDVGKVTIPDGVGALFSCGRGQFAFEAKDLEHGVFFHHVIEALNGEAADREGLVTWADVVRHTQRGVPRFVEKHFGKDGARQVPASVGSLEGETILARVEVAPKDSGKKDGDSKVVKQAKDEFENSLGMKFVRVKKGKFKMGSPKDEKERSDDDEEQHDVEITKDFYMGVTEVTQGQFNAVMKFNPSHCSHDGTKAERKGTYYSDPAAGAKKLTDDGINDTSDFPVENASWEDAQEFLDALNAREKDKKSGWVYVLPTEAQWEYACRGGHSIEVQKDKAHLPFHFKSPTASLDFGQANFDSDYPYGDGKKGKFLGRTNTVGKNGEANSLGIHDMHGNVSEWCSDWYAEGYYRNSPAKDPEGPKDGSLRVLRGGSWNNFGRDCRAAYRGSYSPDIRNRLNGFRVAAVPR